jgi:hypothetical protein
MRRKPSFALRVLLSGAAVLLLALFSLVPTGHEPVSEARPANRPLFQGQPSIDPPEQEDEGTRRDTVSYEFTLSNSSLVTDTFRLEVIPVEPLSGVSASVSPPTLTVLPQSFANFTVRVNIASNAAIGFDVRRVRATSNTDTSITSESTITTRILSPTPTETTTPTETATPSPTNTVGPSPTSGPICEDDVEPNNDIGSAK